MACLPIFFTGHRIARWEGALFFLYYLVYTGFVVMTAIHHDALPMLTQAMVFFALPLTLVTLAVSLVRGWKQKHPQS